jgi:hypothetical protein
MHIHVNLVTFLIEENNMIDGFNEYLDCIKADYIKWQDRCRKGEWAGTEIQKQMAQEFCDGLTFEVGSKYIKVISGRGDGSRSVHSFVCLRDMGKFTKGDILKAAGWASPAKNFARGNTMARTFQNISWTGAM